MAHRDKLMALTQLGALEMRDRLATGALRAVDLVEACLARIEALEPEVGAWSAGW
jgi:aspartyl-tRNA(Asn)/glutamyl-tRNA(Gln) amidotransferase subunit A